MSETTMQMEGLERLGNPPEWLPVIADPDRLRIELMRNAHELATGRAALLDCDVKRVRNKWGTWIGLYLVTVDRGRGREAIQLRGEMVPADRAARGGAVEHGHMGAPDWRLRLPELRLELRAQLSDEALPALAHLTDPRAARAFLERAIRHCSPRLGDLRIAACVPRVMRYKPGSRCTVAYDLEFPADADREGWPTPVIAKTYSGGKGHTAFAGMTSLWRSPLRSSEVVSIAEPLGFVPEANVLIQGPVAHRLTLKELLLSAFAADTSEAIEELEGYMARTALGLAELHSCGAEAGEVVTWQDERAEIEEVLERLQAGIPLLRGAAAPLVARLGELASQSPSDPLRPSHGSFRPAQVLLHDGSIGFIDFDGFCSAEPAMDIALFRATTKDIGLKAMRSMGASVPTPAARLERLARLDDLCELFIARYETVSPVSRARVALWEALDMLAAVVHCWTKVKFERMEHRMDMLQAHLETVDGL